MKILVYGAGNIGSLYAARLKEAGQDVTVLARRARLAEIREHGIRLQDFCSDRKSTTKIEAVERLAPEDEYDLVLVILPRNSISETLPILAANQNTPSVMFFGNNAGGIEEMVAALGCARVLLGFPAQLRCPTTNASDTSSSIRVSNRQQLASLMAATRAASSHLGQHSILPDFQMRFARTWMPG